MTLFDTKTIMNVPSANLIAKNYLIDVQYGINKKSMVPAVLRLVTSCRLGPRPSIIVSIEISHGCSWYQSFSYTTTLADKHTIRLQINSYRNLCSPFSQRRATGGVLDTSGKKRLQTPKGSRITGIPLTYDSYDSGSFKRGVNLSRPA